jgi:hypothetical protein
MRASSEPIAGDRVTHREREETERNGDHHDVQHGSHLLAAYGFAANLRSDASFGRAGAGYLTLATYVFEG